jgi:hypothetical protein
VVRTLERVSREDAAALKTEGAGLLDFAAPDARTHRIQVSAAE